MLHREREGLEVMFLTVYSAASIHAVPAVHHVRRSASGIAATASAASSVGGSASPAK